MRFKKVISTVLAVSLSAVAASTTVSCSRDFGGYESPDTSKISKTYLHDFNWQSGPAEEAKDLNNNFSNEYITSFNGSALSSYATYNISSGRDGWSKPEFYGDEDQFLKTSDDKFIQQGWLNDSINMQNIIKFKKPLDNYSNIQVSVVDKTKNLTDEQKLIGDASFEKYILTNGFVPKSCVNTILDKRQYIPDAMEGNHIDSLGQNVSIDKGSTYKKVFFDIQNVWINLKSSLSTKIGMHDVNFIISFDYGQGKETSRKSFIKHANVNIKNVTFDRTDVDENSDGILNYADKFGLSASTFPIYGLKQWDSNQYGKVKNYNVTAMQGTKQWIYKLNDDLLSNGNLQFKNLYNTYGSNVEIESFSNGEVTFSTTRSDLRTNALIGVYSNGVLVATLSVYYNKYNEPMHIPSVNKSDEKYDNNGKSNRKITDDSVDVNCDGKVDSSDWDVDGDGIYTREDWNGNGDGNNDTIGPDPNYADYVRRDPTHLNELDKEFNGLGQLNSYFVQGTGSHKQLIQYSGNLQDSSLKRTFNGKDSGPADDYEQALIDANKDQQKYISFISSSDSKDSSGNYKHHWEWKFDFTNLDIYMREAAANNISSVMINPIDVGGVMFWYLKGKGATIGPERFMLDHSGYSKMSLIDANTGRLSSTGKAYLDNVVVPMSKELSQHMANIKDDPAYKTKDGQNMRIYYTFDEVNESTVDNVMKEVVPVTNPDGKIYSSVFLGWRSDLSTNSQQFDSPILERDFEDKYMDQIIIVYRQFIQGSHNSDLLSIRRKSINRAKKGKTTMFYTTWDQHPGGFLQDDLSYDYWQMFFAYKLGMNGYVRWAFDEIFNKAYDTSVLDNEPTLQKDTSGQSFLIYGGNDSDGVHFSRRYLAYNYALNYVYKIKKILYGSSQEDKNIFSRIIKQGVGKALMNIGFSSLDYSNNDWKYNLRNRASADDFTMLRNDNAVTMSEQVYKLISFIDNL